MSFSRIRAAHLVQRGGDLRGARGPGVVLVLVLTFVVFGRAAIVPSTALRTLITTIACGSALIPLVAVHSLSSFDAVLFWSLTTAIATFTSSGIYDLRLDVEEARDFGQYQLLEKIGDGGMGVVYRARHGMLRRATALKLLPPRRSTAAALIRFEREVQLTARLRHPNTVTIFDYGRTPEPHLLFHHGAPRRRDARRPWSAPVGPCRPARVVCILRQVAGALAEAPAVTAAVLRTRAAGCRRLELERSPPPP